MFTINQDYIIKNSDTDVLTLQENGKFELKNCYFLEFMVRTDVETLKKIKTICEPFSYSAAIQYAISRYNAWEPHRLFLLVAPETFKNKFKDHDDFLAIVLCNDTQQSTFIKYFEVNYNFRHSYEQNQKYKCIGTATINALKRIYKPRELWGISAFEAINFWLKNGFTRIDEREQYLHWQQR